MAEQTPNRWMPPLRILLGAAALGVVYAGLYKLVELETSFGSSVGAAFWPASGLTVSVLLLRPRREWPAHVAAIFIAETAMDLQAGFTGSVSVGMGVANCAEPLIAATLLLHWLGRPPDLSQLEELMRFILAALVAGPMTGALVAAGWPWILGIDPLWPRLGRWYLGDAIGVLVVAPLIISVARPPAQSLLRLSEAWTLGVLAVVALIALPWRWTAEIGLPFMVIPALALVGMRMGTRAAAAGVFGVGILVEAVTAMGGGPFTGDRDFSGLLVAQMYLATCGLSSLTAAALMTGLASRDELALHDSLTGLPNRRLLFDRLNVACRHIARSSTAVGLVFVDLDGFKSINDEHGHAAGDQVLIESARRLRTVVRDEDTVARLGGDEFVVLVGHLEDDRTLPELADRISAATRAPILLDSGIIVEVSGSVGIATSRTANEDPETLLGRADRAMYEAKHAHGTAR